MGFNISVENSCKLIAISGDRYDQTATQADIVLENMEDGTSYTVTMAYDGSGKGTLNFPSENLPSQYGVYRACLSENGLEYGCKPFIIKCNIDCCLNKLTYELIDCHCDCARCATAMAKAQKIYLLLQSAISSVEIAGENQSNSYYIDILHKYNKAKEICDNSCGCDC
tara:strand:- start:254 stop:757 length:504 start_codon:yes stop_codon:yes gene_type:complete